MLIINNMKNFKFQIRKRVLNMTFKMEMTMLNVNDRHSVWAPDKRLEIEWARNRQLNIVSLCCLHDTIAPRLLVHYYIFEEIPTTTNNQRSMSALYLMINSQCTHRDSFFLLQSSPRSRFVNIFINWHLSFSSIGLHLTRWLPRLFLVCERFEYSFFESWHM